MYTFLYSLGWLAAGTRLFVLLAGVGMLKWVEAGEALGDHLWPPFNGNHQHQQWHAAIVDCSVFALYFYLSVDK